MEIKQNGNVYQILSKNLSYAEIIETEKVFVLNNLACMEEEEKMMIDFIENLAKEKNKSGIHVIRKTINDTTWKNYIYLNFIDRLYFEKLFGYQYSNGFFKCLKSENPIYKENEKYIDAMKKVKELYPTNTLYELSRISEIVYAYYYSTGKPGKIFFQIEDGKYKIADKEENLSIIHDDLLQGILQFFSEVHKKRRLNSIFQDPPTYHFKNACKNFLEYQVIRTALLEKYDNEEIEVFFSNHDNPIDLIYNRHHFLLFKVMENYLIIRKMDNHYRLIKEKEDAIHYLKDEIQKQVEIDIENLKKQMQ